MLKEHRWRFDAEMPDDCQDAAARFSPREMRKRILDAMGNAKVAGRERVCADDFGKAGARKATIGFVTC